LVSISLSIMLLQVRVNLPNGDMVGHTGDIEATVVACKAADEAVKVRASIKVRLHVCCHHYSALEVHTSIKVHLQ
jgi:bisphosphoglycerate-independent phosphoglycerate mutase (AlkP superfamily)